MRRLTRHFFEGLLIVAPIAFTIFVFYKLFVLIDMPLRNVFHSLFGVYIPGIGFLITAILAGVVLTTVGALSSNLLARGLLEIMERQIARFPLVKLLHSSVKDFVGAFVGDKKRFDQPVLVTPLAGSDLRLAGFVTRKTMEMWGLNDHVAVYLPMAFNFGGNMVLVPKERISPLSIPSGDVMAFVVSGGIAGEANSGAEKPEG